MKRILAALLIITLLPAAAFARFEKLAKDVDSMFSRMTGYVVSVEGNEIYTDLGFGSGVYPGLEMNIYRESEEIVHPITGQVLGKKKAQVAEIRINEVFDSYSTASVLSKESEPVKGDLAILNPPVPVQINYKDISRRLQLLLKEDISSGKNIVIKDSADIVITFTQAEEGGIRYEARDTKADTLISSNFYSDIETGDGSGKLTRDTLMSEQVEEEYKGMSVGHIFNDKDIHIATVGYEKVDFYLFNGESFSFVDSIKDIDNVVSVEVMDLNKNGIDEVFISRLQYGKFVKTNIYEYKGNSFKQIESGLPYFVRAAYDRGQKVLVAQKLTSEGEFVGQIQKVVYSGRYQRGEAIDGTVGVGIFGFGYSDITGDGLDDVLYIGDDYHLNVESEDEVIYTTLDTFSKTPHFFLIEYENLSSDIDKLEEEMEENPFLVEEKRKYLKGRVFVNRDGRVYVVKNVALSKVLPNTRSYKASTFSVYEWTGDALSRVWESDKLEPVIADYYMYEEYGRTYLFLLRNISMGMFRGKQSQLIYIETK
ncbi:hypothetical protein [Limisalsivibrio acetivorans]|uniref:hypothetical protein n=1 Tax=Limisalsivibrio acetivorans TaxID=1304888 RepID=UPI0003B7A48A|nr:hypothetical protein [Limisalsivibrio acetivorans]